MGFVNEIVSQENIEKYGLNSLHKKYSEEAGNKMMAMHDIESDSEWMVDKENNIWFMRLGIRKIPGENPPIYPGDDIYILHYKGKNIEVCMERKHDGYSKDLNENPFQIGWNILSVSPVYDADISTETIYELIQEAMNVFGYAGMRRQRPHTGVDVNVTVEKGLQEII